MGGIDVSGVLKLIGGIKQLKAGSVYAEGTNIIKQSPGASILGDDSLINKISSLKDALSSGGLSQVFSNNPVASVISQIQSANDGAIPTVSAMVTAPPSGSNSTTPVPLYPTFVPALKTASAQIANFYNWSKLLSGQQVPDYNNDEYGLTDILQVSESGNSALSDLAAPLMINDQLRTVLGQLTTLVQQVTSQSIADADATTKLQSLMSTLTASVSVSNVAYNRSSSDDAQSSVIGLALAYVNGTPSTESDFVQTLLDPTLTPLVIDANQDVLAEVESNKADAQLQMAERRRIHQLMKDLLDELDKDAGSRNEPKDLS